MHLLATVIPAQRRGVGRLHLPGWQVYFKGGWGAGTGEVEHQVVLLRHGPLTPSRRCRGCSRASYVASVG
jgi:hypothetical protein